MWNNWIYYVQKTHAILWFSLIFYLIFETIRSWDLAHEYPIQLLRWLGLFILLIPLYFILKSEAQKEYKNLSLFIICCSIAYSVAYLAQGMILELNGISRFADQGKFVTGSSYAVLPFIVVIPVVFRLISSPNAKIRALVIICICLIVSVGFYYDSRILGLFCLGSMALSWFILPWRKALLYCSVMAGMWVLLSLYMTYRRSTDNVPDKVGQIFSGNIDTYAFTAYLDLYGGMVGNTSNIASGSVQVGDADRLSHITAPINAVTVNPLTVLFGYGTYEHHLVLNPFLQQAVDDRGLNIKINEFVRTTGFGAYIADYGIVGFALLCANFVCTGLKLVYERNKLWLILGYSLGACFMWLFVSNILDNMLFWFILCPFGILWKLGIDKQ